MDESEWSSRYRESNTKWDLGRSPGELLEFMRMQPAERTVLIPGCGRGYEISDLRRLGHSVCAVDFSEEAIRAAKSVIGDFADEIICGDFFGCDLPLGSFDICYERTFLCALPEELRERYGERIASLLKDGGVLAGVFHYGQPEDSDPPYPMTDDDRAHLLEGHFSLIADDPYESGLPVYSDHVERWQVWGKK